MRFECFILSLPLLLDQLLLSLGSLGLNWWSFDGVIDLFLFFLLLLFFLFFILIVV
jgi:hypothetical protein